MSAHKSLLAHLELRNSFFCVPPRCTGCYPTSPGTKRGIGVRRRELRKDPCIETCIPMRRLCVWSFKALGYRAPRHLQKTDQASSLRGPQISCSVGHTLIIITPKRAAPTDGRRSGDSQLIKCQKPHNRKTAKGSFFHIPCYVWFDMTLLFREFCLMVWSLLDFCSVSKA